MGSSNSVEHRRLTKIDTDDRHPACPYCGTWMRPWPARTPAKHCEVCHQPMLLIPAKLSKPAYYATHLCSSGHIALMPIIAGTLAALAFGIGSFYAIALALTLLTLMTGSLMVYEGTANMTSRISRLRKDVTSGRKAWWRGLIRTIVGFYAIAAGLGCLFVLVPIAERWANLAA